jgi:hypothetical protein
MSYLYGSKQGWLSTLLGQIAATDSSPSSFFTEYSLYAFWTQGSGHISYAYEPAGTKMQKPTLTSTHTGINQRSQTFPILEHFVAEQNSSDAALVHFCLPRQNLRNF